MSGVGGSPGVRYDRNGGGNGGFTNPAGPTGFYNRGELDGGQLDNRYYTQTVSDNRYYQKTETFSRSEVQSGFVQVQTSVVQPGGFRLGGSGELASLTTGGVDSYLTAGSDVFNLCTSNANVINIGWSGAVINLYGSTVYNYETNLAVSDKLVRYNVGGGTGTGFSSGFEIEEGGVVTGWFATNANRNGWDFKAPATQQWSILHTALTASRSVTAPDLSGTLMLTDAGQTVTSATWQGTRIGVQYGGTGANLSATGGANQIVKQQTAGGPFTVGLLTTGEIPDLSAFYEPMGYSYSKAESNARYAQTITLNTPNMLYSTPITYVNDGAGNFSGSLSLNTQSANRIFAGPASGAAASPTFRQMVAADLNSLAVLNQTTMLQTSPSGFFVQRGLVGLAGTDDATSHLQIFSLSDLTKAIRVVNSGGAETFNISGNGLTRILNLQGVTANPINMYGATVANNTYSWNWATSNGLNLSGGATSGYFGFSGTSVTLQNANTTFNTFDFNHTITLASNTSNAAVHGIYWRPTVSDSGTGNKVIPWRNDSGDIYLSFNSGSVGIGGAPAGGYKTSIYAPNTSTGALYLKGSGISGNLVLYEDGNGNALFKAVTAGRFIWGPIGDNGVDMAQINGNLFVGGVAGATNIKMNSVTGIYGSSSIAGIYNAGGTVGYIGLGFSSTLANLGLFVYQNSNDPTVTIGQLSTSANTGYKLFVYSNATTIGGARIQGGNNTSGNALLVRNSTTDLLAVLNGGTIQLNGGVAGATETFQVNGAIRNNSYIRSGDPSASGFQSANAGQIKFGKLISGGLRTVSTSIWEVEVDGLIIKVLTTSSL